MRKAALILSLLLLPLSAFAERPNQPQPGTFRQVLAMWVDVGSAQNLFRILSAGKGTVLPGSVNDVMPVWLSYSEMEEIAERFATANGKGQTSVTLSQGTAQDLLESLETEKVGTFSGKATNVIPLASLESGVSKLLVGASALALTQRSSGLFFVTPLADELLQALRNSGGASAPKGQAVAVSLDSATVAQFSQGGMGFSYRDQLMAYTQPVEPKNQLTMSSDDVKTWIGALEGGTNIEVSLKKALSGFALLRTDFDPDGINTEYVYSAFQPQPVYDDVLDRLQSALAN